MLGSNWSPVGDYQTIYRTFMNVMDKESSIRKILDWHSGSDGDYFWEARFVETLYDVSGTVKRGVRIEIVRMPLGEIDPEFINTLFSEGRTYEMVLRSAMRHARKAQGQNAITRTQGVSGPIVTDSMIDNLLKGLG